MDPEEEDKRSTYVSVSTVGSFLINVEIHPSGCHDCNVMIIYSDRGGLDKEVTSTPISLS